MKPVCFFAGNMDCGGGTERVLSVIGNALSAEGISVVLINLYGGKNPFFELDTRIKIHSLFERKVSFIRNFFEVIWRLRRLLRHIDVGTLISVESSQSIFSLPATAGLGIRHINWEHFNYGVDLGFWPRKLARSWVARWSDDTVVLTERDVELWSQGTHIRGHITSIPNPIPFSLTEKRRDVAENLVIAVGRMTYQKGFDLLIEAWAAIGSASDSWKLCIIGDGEDRTLLQKQIDAVGLQDRIELCEPTQDIASYYRRARWFCLSSRFEGLPMVLLEACAWGLPIVAFDCDTGPAEVVEHEVNGYLCQSENPAALSLSLRNALSLSNEKYESMSTASFSYAEHFSIGPIIQRWLELLRFKQC